VIRIHPHAGTFKSYMDNFVTPVLFKGLQELSQRRPDTPIEFLAYYLLDNNPALKKRMEEIQLNNEM
jgi:Dpy-30 motif